MGWSGWFLIIVYSKRGGKGWFLLIVDFSVFGHNFGFKTLFPGSGVYFQVLGNFLGFWVYLRSFGYFIILFSFCIELW